MLARGELRAIGATTLDEYRKHIEKDAALERRFQPVMVGEPTVEDAIAILRGLKPRYEEHHRVEIQDAALIAAATLSHRYRADLQQEADRLKAEWQAEREAVQSVTELKAQLEQTEHEIARAQREGDLQRAAELTYSELPELRKQIAEAEERTEGDTGVQVTS